MPRFTTALFTTVKTWKQPKRPSAGEWRNTMWYIHPLKYHPALRRSGTMSRAETWISTEDLTQSEMSQKDNCRGILLPQGT